MFYEVLGMVVEIGRLRILFFLELGINWVLCAYDLLIVKWNLDWVILRVPCSNNRIQSGFLSTVCNLECCPSGSFCEYDIFV